MSINYSKRFAHSAGPLTLRVQALPEGSFSCAKTVSKLCPEIAKMDPAAKVMHSKLQNGTKWRQGVVFVNVPRPFWSFLGTQRDSENPSRIDFLLKSAFQTYYFLAFFVQIVLPVFFKDFVSIFRKKSMKTWWKHQGIFSHHRLFFWTWRPSRNIVFYDTKATFSFFEFLFFPTKNARTWV